ncbi:hypothetical protein, partial [Photorhabdus khanii]|uniref:hypothetical protein n=1 Tax=Photorhabdus khanii TaxID=1004150 RepID=UPI00195F8235
KHVGLPGHYQALVRLEPCALKGARTVLRGLETGNCLWLLCEICALVQTDCLYRVYPILISSAK